MLKNRIGRGIETIFGGIQDPQVVLIGMLREQEWRNDFEQCR